MPQNTQQNIGLKIHNRRQLQRGSSGKSNRIGKPQVTAAAIRATTSKATTSAAAAASSKVVTSDGCEVSRDPMYFNSPPGSCPRLTVSSGLCSWRFCCCCCCCRCHRRCCCCCCCYCSWKAAILTSWLASGTQWRSTGSEWSSRPSSEGGGSPPHPVVSPVFWGQMGRQTGRQAFTLTNLCASGCLKARECGSRGLWLRKWWSRRVDSLNHDKRSRDFRSEQSVYLPRQTGGILHARPAAIFRRHSLRLARIPTVTATTQSPLSHLWWVGNMKEKPP